MLRLILTSRVYDVCRETPLDPAPRLSARLGRPVLFKREDLQPVFSFKLRGAYNRIAHLTEAERARGVIAVSAGNHAQGVAYSARKLGIRAVIVMPQTTPEIKVEAVRRLGAEVVLYGDSYSDAKVAVRRVAARERRDADSSRSTTRWSSPGRARSATRCCARASATCRPCSSPSAAAGSSRASPATSRRCGPTCRSSASSRSRPTRCTGRSQAGRRVTLDHVGIFADGVAVREVGVHTFAIAQQAVDEVVRVTNDEICAAIKDVFDDTRSIMEPAGALAVAGLKTWVAAHPEDDGPRGRRAQRRQHELRSAALRRRARRAGRGARGDLRRDDPRAARRVSRVLRAARPARGHRVQLPPGQPRCRAHLRRRLSVASREDAATLARELNAAGYETLDLSDNELAKLHVRHMVGGRASDARHERPCRFEFPERPGALMQFLETLGGRWNISLFHYRNHGADFGRVLAAFEVPDEELGAFKAFLDGLGYPYLAEFGNDAYRLFLE